MLSLCIEMCRLQLCGVVDANIDEILDLPGRKGGSGKVLGILDKLMSLSEDPDYPLTRHVRDALNEEF